MWNIVFWRYWPQNSGGWQLRLTGRNSSGRETWLWLQLMLKPAVPIWASPPWAMQKCDNMTEYLLGWFQEGHLHFWVAMIYVLLCIGQSVRLSSQSSANALAKIWHITGWARNVPKYLKWTHIAFGMWMTCYRQKLTVWNSTENKGSVCCVDLDNLTLKGPGRQTVNTNFWALTVHELYLLQHSRTTFKIGIPWQSNHFLVSHCVKGQNSVLCVLNLLNIWTYPRFPRGRHVRRCRSPFPIS